jgi:hypothetical protein
MLSEISPEGADASSRASFSSLPIELRRLIWVATFEPQILTVEAHIVTPYAIHTTKPKYGTWCRMFTAKLGIHPNRNPRNIVLSQDATQLLPPGPVALNVCRESRAIALENYHLVFHGSVTCVRDHPSALEWVGGLDQGKIWVD